MITELKEWSQAEAEEIFNRIVKEKGRIESFDIDLKQKLCWEDTSIQSSNTTQRAFSGFANTYGGYLIIGFNNEGELIGVDDKKDIENNIIEKLSSKLRPANREYLSSLFKAKYYKFSDNNILIIFIKKSDIPIQCDNGVYYYREQSQFKFMLHEMLEDKFRRSFEDEKNVYLVINELEHLTTGIKYLVKEDESIKLDFLLGYIIKSQESLYYFYKRNNLSEIVYRLVLPLKSLCAYSNLIKRDISYSVIGDAKDLLKKLKEIQEKELMK
jgi:hypothetical protein